MCTFASPAELADSTAAAHDDPGFAVTTSFENGSYLVHVSGELDIATRDLVHRACLAGEHVSVAVEMADTTFMDCSGYGGLVAARLDLERRGATLTLRDPTGQPADLLAMLAGSEGSAPAP